MPFDLPALYKMFEEIRAVNIEKGWQPHNLELGEVMALLHSEVGEMTDAFRRWGLEDHTPIGYEDLDLDITRYVKLPKPEGVGSEMADVLIRLLDNYEMFHTYLNYLTPVNGRFGMSDRFGNICGTLHLLIARLHMAIESYESCPLPEEIPQIGRHFRDVYQYLIQAAEHFGIDIKAEYERKLAYNKTREFRHGNKRM